MKEQLHTIPISDAMANAGECPFCYIEQKTEEHMMDFVLGHGASYMEADIRDMTDREGFCRAHFKKMFDYGNSLGNAWILKTLMKRHEEEMDHVWKTSVRTLLQNAAVCSAKKQMVLPIPLSSGSTGGNPPVSSVTV